MKKILCLLVILILLSSVAFAENRITKTTVIKTSSALIKRGDAKILRVEYIATSNGGGFSIHDALTQDVTTDIKSEGSQATSGNSGVYDYTGQPLEVSTGLYLTVVNASVVITYE